MKKIFSTKLLFAVAAWFLIAACAFTDTGNRVSDERESLENMEHQRENQQARYVIVLNGLERYPGDAKLEHERDLVRKRILELDRSISEQRQVYESSVQQWEQKITEDKLQKEIEEREEIKNAGKSDEN